MTVIVLTACKSGLRGDLTRWLLEVAPGVFIGRVSSRVRERLWMRVGELIGLGKGLLVYSTNNEQRLHFETINHDWTPTDYDGITLMMRPNEDNINPEGGRVSSSKKGWSNASRRRKYGR